MQKVKQLSVDGAADHDWMRLTKIVVLIYRYCLNNSKFVGQPFLSKIVTGNIVATRCQILKQKCTKFYFGWGSAPDPAGGAYSAPQVV